MITVQGNLKDPLGKGLVGAYIRFTAVASEGDLFKGISGEALTGSGGAYNFTLHKGRYRLEVLLTDEYHESGIVLVDDNTPTEITLVQLWAYAAPLNPPLLNPAKPVWDELYQGVLAGDEWAREAEEQVRDTNVLVNEDKSIHKSGEAYLAKETLTSSIGSVNQSTQVLTYKDEYAQEASASTTEVHTRNATGSESIGSYTHSDGSTEVQKRVELTGTTGSTTKVMTEGKDTYAKVVGVQSTHSEESAGSTTAVYKHGNNQVSTSASVQYIDADKFVQALIEQNVKLTYSNNGFPVEAFNRLLVNPHGSTNTIQADKHIIQAVDGFPVATFDTANREIIFDSKLTFKNTDDFIGEEGWSYDWDFEYSNDQLVWKPDYTFGDIWRKERKFKFKEADPEGTKQYIGEAIIVQLNAKDGLDGDNYYLEYEYTTAQAYPSGWRPNFASGDDWRRWRSVRITPTGTEISKWQEEPMKGTDGPEGWIPEYQTFYGPDATKPLYTDQDHDGSLDDINLAHWHQNMSEGDLYKFERKVWWKSQADFTASRTDLTMVPHVMEPWNGPNKIMPVAGEDYGDRFASLYLYKRAATKPSDALGVWRYNFDSLTLEPVNGNFLGWSTSVVNGLEHLWVATATAHSLTNVDDHIDNWDVDKLTSNGLKNATAYLYRLSDGATTSVALPTNALTYNFLTGLVEGTPTNGWLATPPNNTTEQGKLWRTFAPVTAEAFTDKEPIAANDWETATVLAQNGGNGSNGINGLSTVLVHLYKRASSAGSLPSTTSTYTFSTKTLTGFNNGWSTTIPAGSGTIWVTVATASSIGDTDTIAANEWAGAVQFSENGVSVTGVVNYYAKHTSNTTAPTIGSAAWVTTVPTVDATNKYLWNYEQITYSAGSPTNTPPAVIGTFGEKGIQSITEYYLLNNVSTGVVNSSGAWVTTPAVTTPTNRYLWNYELVTYTDGSTTKTPAVVIGVHGEQGVGITTVLNEYGLSDSTTTEPTSWTTTVPTTTTSQRYLWNREKVTYSNASTITTPAAIIGTYSKDGKGIVSITEWYLVTNSTTAPSISDSGWSTTLQLTSTSNKYLWNKEVIKYTEGSDVTTAPVIIGTHGADGVNGVGITGVVNYYAKSSSATTSPTSWETAVPTLDVTNKYLWNYEKVTSSDGTSVSTPPAVIGTLSVDGVGISSVTEYYLVSSSSTGITTSTTGWTTTPQLTTTTNKYLWNYEKVTYSNNNVVNSTPVVIGTHGETGIGITGVTNYYAKSTSSTTAPTTWATTVPVLDTTNKYLWNYEKVTRSDGSSIDSVPAVIGTMSVDGVGIKSVVEYYLASTSSSGVTVSTSGWTTNIQTTDTSKRFLWNYEVTTYTDNSTTTTAPVIIGTHGATGANGVGVAGVVNEYAKHTSATTAPTSGWSTAVPTLDRTNKYLWNRETVSYTSGSPTVTPAALIGTLSEDGKGIVSITEYYLASASSTGVTTATAGWTTTPQTTSTSKRYLWNYEVVKYTVGSDTITTPVIIGTHGETGPQGVAGTNGTNGVTTYTWIRYADTSTGEGISNDPTGKSYIGFAYNKTTSTESNTPSDYMWSLIKGDKGNTGATGAPGANGTTTYTWIKYSDVSDGTGLYDVPTSNTQYIGIAINKATATESTNKADYTWSKFKGDQGPQGVQGPIGPQGETTYTWIRYADTATGTGISNDPTGKEYIGFAYNKATATESNTPSDYSWSLIKGEQGVQGPQGPDGESLYTWIKYSNAADGTGLYDIPTANTQYIGIAVNKSTPTESTNKADYVWSKFKGEQGDQGPQGVQGPAGADGQTTYTWIRYADDINGSGISNDPLGKEYIGFAYNKTTATESNVASDYTWALIKGDKGDQGVEGSAGQDGQTTYTWIKYSDNADGTGLYDLPTANTQYIGIATNKLTASESTNKADYIWSKFRGDTGPQGIKGPTGPQGATTYTWIRYADSVTGSGISNDPSGKKYIGLAYNKTSPTESNTASDYTWSLIQGPQGDQGVPGAAGADGVTTYTWIKYSDNADGTGLYDTPTTSTNYIGIATNKTTATESTNKADYIWSLFKGANGANGVDGINAAMLMVFQRTTGTPSKPSANVVYNFTSGALSGLNNGWNTTIPSGTAPVWVTTASALSQAATDTITPSEWATPVMMAQSGMGGKHGAGSYVITVTDATYIPNDAGKDNHILQLSSRGAIAGDIITYTDAGRTFSKSYLRGASTWTEFKYTFDGSVIVNGTLAAETLKSGTSITDKLHISSTKNPAEMTLSGTSDWRIWLGNAEATSAPFRVDKWGNLTAANANLTNATVVGKVTATSGSFTGTVNASSGSFTGTVNANAGTFNNVTIAENCTILGTLEADRIVGDVTTLVKPSGNFSIPAYKRARNIVCIRPLSGRASVSGAGTIGITLICRMNGIEQGRTTTQASYPAGINKIPMRVSLQEAFVIPANTNASITFEIVPFDSGSNVTDQQIEGGSIWLIGLY